MLNTIAITPKSEDKYVVKVFNWSEVHLSEKTCYKIHTLMINLFFSGVGYYLSSCVNPLLYSVMSKRFRRGFVDMFRRSNSQNAVNLVAAGVAVANGDGGPMAVCSDGGPHHR